MYGAGFMLNVIGGHVRQVSESSGTASELQNKNSRMGYVMKHTVLSPSRARIIESPSVMTDSEHESQTLHVSLLSLHLRPRSRGQTPYPIQLQLYLRQKEANTTPSDATPSVCLFR